MLSVTLKNPEQNDGRAYALNAFFDTGSDVTLIPLEAVSVLRLPLLSGRAPVAGVGGGNTIGFPCQVELQLDAVKLPLLEVVSCEAAAILGQGQMIIGRDVLNQLCVTFDGKRQRFSFEA